MTNNELISICYVLKIFVVLKFKTNTNMKNKLPPTIPSFHKRKDILKKEIWYKGKKRKNKSNIWFFVVKFTFILSLLEVFSCYDSSRMCIHFSASAALSVLFFTFQALLITGRTGRPSLVSYKIASCTFVTTWPPGSKNFNLTD